MAKNKLPVEKLSAKTKKAVPVRIVNETNELKESPGHEERERKWRAEDALRTMKEYEKIRSDKQLMADAQKLAKEEMSKLKKIC